MDFVENLVLFAAVKEFSKSVKNWQSYSHGYDGAFFLTRSVMKWLNIAWYTTAWFFDTEFLMKFLWMP